MFTTRGPLSEENAYLKLWKATNRYKKTIERDNRDSLAVAIHKTFISDKSKFCISLPEDMLKAFDPDVSHDRPGTAALKDLQKLAEENLSLLIEQFLQSVGKQYSSLTAIQERARLLQLALAKVPV